MKPEVSEQDRRFAAAMKRRANLGWYTGTEETLALYGQRRDVSPGRTDQEIAVLFFLSKDRMHHSVGWWRNAEYEYCWHLSMSAWDRLAKIQGRGSPVDIPPDEERYWAHAFFPEHYDKLWHEPGGTDPRLTPLEARRNRHISHLRLFLDPETFEPFIPTGEVYDLTRWIDGLTPDKVDR